MGLVFTLSCAIIKYAGSILPHSGCKSSSFGLASQAFYNWQFSASSHNHERDCNPYQSRMDQFSYSSWCPKIPAANQWLQIDLGTPSKVYGIITQGRPASKEWITTFAISHSLDQNLWHFVKNSFDLKEVFTGNKDDYSFRLSYFNQPIKSRFIRIHVLSWKHYPSLRFDLLGCGVCMHTLRTSTVSKTPDRDDFYKNREYLLQWPMDINIINNHTLHKWYLVDAGKVTRITGILTKGDLIDKACWVKAFNIRYSKDGISWKIYKDSIDKHFKEFQGNFDSLTERVHFLNVPFNARFVYVYPTRWNNLPLMKINLRGCELLGKRQVRKADQNTTLQANEAYQSQTVNFNMQAENEINQITIVYKLGNVDDLSRWSTRNCCVAVYMDLKQPTLSFHSHSNVNYRERSNRELCAIVCFRKLYENRPKINVSCLSNFRFIKRFTARSMNKSCFNNKNWISIEQLYIQF